MNDIGAGTFSYKIENEDKNELLGVIYFARGDKAKKLGAVLDELDEEEEE